MSMQCGLGYYYINLTNIITEDEFDQLPLAIEGESRIVRYVGGSKFVLIKFKPTVYSLKENTYRTIDGLDTLRLQAAKIFLEVLNEKNIVSAYRYINVENKMVLADLLLHQVSDINKQQFRPKNVWNGHFAIAPPIETTVKAKHVGTPKHAYYGLSGYITRDHSIIEDGKEYDSPIVRFYWRNPLQNDKGIDLKDELIDEGLANKVIDTKKAKHTALKIFSILKKFLAKKGMQLNDICLFLDQNGEINFSEISMDCMTVDFLIPGAENLKAGGSHGNIQKRWALMLALMKMPNKKAAQLKHLQYVIDSLD